VEPHGQARGTTLFRRFVLRTAGLSGTTSRSPQSALHIHPRLKPWPSASGVKRLRLRNPGPVLASRFSSLAQNYSARAGSNRLTVKVIRNRPAIILADEQRNRRTLNETLIASLACTNSSIPGGNRDLCFFSPPTASLHRFQKAYPDIPERTFRAPFPSLRASSGPRWLYPCYFPPCWRKTRSGLSR